jgi:hypothetical protein
VGVDGSKLEAATSDRRGYNNFHHKINQLSEQQAAA